MSISSSLLREVSKAAREGAKLHNVSPVTATRAVNDTVREGVANLIPSKSISSALKGSIGALKTGKPPRAGSNPGGFYDDVLHNMDFLDGKKQNPGNPSWSSPEFKLPRVPRGTVKASKGMTLAKKKAIIASKSKTSNPNIMSPNPSGAGAKASTLKGRSWMWNIGAKTK